MRTFTVTTHVGNKPYEVLVCVLQGTPPTLYLSNEVFCNWTLLGNQILPWWEVTEGWEELRDAAFLEACRQEEEDLYESIEQSEIGF